MVFEKLKLILSEQFDIDDTDITMETDLFDDLDADSLDLADLIASVEDEFDIDIGSDSDMVSNVSTVGDIVNYITDLKGIS